MYTHIEGSDRRSAVITINSNDKISMFLLFPVPPDTIVNQQVHGMLDYTVKQLKVKLLKETVIYVSLQAILLKTCKRRLIMRGLLF